MRKKDFVSFCPYHKHSPKQESWVSMNSHQRLNSWCLLQVYVSAEHPGQRGERLCLPRDLHDDWCEPRRCGAGEAVNTAVIRKVWNSQTCCFFVLFCFVKKKTHILVLLLCAFRTSSSSVTPWPPGWTPKTIWEICSTRWGAHWAAFIGLVLLEHTRTTDILQHFESFTDERRAVSCFLNHVSCVLRAGAPNK